MFSVYRPIMFFVAAGGYLVRKGNFDRGFDTWIGDNEFTFLHLSLKKCEVHLYTICAGVVVIVEAQLVLVISSVHAFDRCPRPSVAKAALLRGQPGTRIVENQVYLCEGEDSWLQADHFAQKGGHDPLQDRKPGSQNLARAMVEFEQMGQEEHRRRGRSDEVRFAVCDRLHSRVHVPKSNWRAWICDGEHVATYIWVVACRLAELYESLLVTQVCTRAVLDVDERLEDVVYPCGVGFSSNVGMA